MAAWRPVVGLLKPGRCPERAWGRILQAFVRDVKMFAGLKCFITFASPKEKFFLNPNNRERGIWEIK
jgi:hypothetical protein